MILRRYFTDLYKSFNYADLQLQGDNLNLIKTKNVIAGFVAKLLLYKNNIGRHEFHNFANLSAVSLNNDDLLLYCKHFENIPPPQLFHRTIPGPFK